jgi:anti-sigma factor (TIGR02949 family)
MTVMKRCADLDALVTPFVDGEASPEDQAAVADHLEACPPCKCRAGIERAARQIVREHAASLATAAPPGLRSRCRRGASVQAGWRQGALALAATLLLALGGALAYSTFINPSAAIVAQLALDHLKCFALFDQPDALDPAAVRAELLAQHGWDVPIPGRGETTGLSLIGGRRCVYLDGQLAHLLYKRGTVPVSVFVLPAGKSMPAGRRQLMGYSAVALERGGRTWVVLAHEPPAEVLTIASRFDTGL